MDARGGVVGDRSNEVAHVKSSMSNISLPALLSLSVGVGDGDGDGVIVLDEVVNDILLLQE